MIEAKVPRVYCPRCSKPNGDAMRLWCDVRSCTPSLEAMAWCDAVVLCCLPDIDDEIIAAYRANAAGKKVYICHSPEECRYVCETLYREANGKKIRHIEITTDYMP